MNFCQSLRLYGTFRPVLSPLKCSSIVWSNSSPPQNVLCVVKRQKCAKIQQNWCFSIRELSSKTVPRNPNDDEDLGRLLYMGKDSKRLQWLLGGFYSMSFGITVTSIYVFSEMSGSLLPTVAVATNVFLFAVVNPYALYQFGKRYVSKLYHNSKSDMYTVELLSPFVIQSKRLKYSPKECKMPSGPSMFTSYYVNKHPLFVNSDDMKYKDYMTMLRYAVDYDFENPDRQQQYDEAVSSAIKKKQGQTKDKES